MITKPNFLFLALLLLSPAVTSPRQTMAQTISSANSAMNGTVKDPSGAVLPGAKIVLRPTDATAASDAQGSFTIRDLKPGTYTVTISYVGFASFTSTIVVEAGAPAVLNATLSVGANAQHVEVNANLIGDAAAINETRTSENILNVETDVEIQSLPNANVADALGRLPGVTLQRNEGEGQYVQIRGTEPRLSNTTIDGVIVPGPDPEVRQVDLDTIPAGLVGSVAINKTLSANQDGDAIGGSVDLRIKQATADRPTISIEGMGGFTPIANTRNVFSMNSSSGIRFGPRLNGGSKKFGLELGYSYDDNQRGIDDVEPSPDIDQNGNKTFDSMNLQQYLYDRTRYGFAGALDYQPSAGANLYAHGLFSNFRDYGQKYAYELQNGSKAKYHTSIRRPNLQVADLALGGSHVFGNSFLKYQVAAAHSRFGGAAGNPGAAFKGTSATDDCAYNPATPGTEFRPQFSCSVLGDPAVTLSNYKLDTIDLTSGQATQLNLQANGSYGRNYHLGSHASTFELGAQVRNEHKGQDAYSPEYDSNLNTLASAYLGSFSNPHFYGGSYPMAQVTSFDAITGDLANNPQNFALDPNASHEQSDPANYNLQERVTAGYIMNTLQLGSKVHLQTGLRIEATSTSNTGYIVTTNSDGTWGGTTPQNGSESYINPLPSVQLRYTIDSSSDLRAVYGRGISRPDPYQLVPYLVYTVNGAPAGNNEVQLGNPALVAEHANDYDLLYEKYLPNVGMLQGGYFYKQITKPIYLQQYLVPATNSPLSSNSNYVGALAQQEVNGDHAYVQGLEIAYQQHLKFLPGYLGNARLNANFTYTNSKNYNLAGRNDTPQLVGQAPYSWNIGPSYATRRFLASVGISHNSANIYAYQFVNSGDALAQNPPTCVSNITSGSLAYNTPSSPCGDNYFYSHTQIDAQVSYHLLKGFTVIASGENMNNEVFGFYNGSPQYLTQREYYKPTYSFGLKWNFHQDR
ncbi:TonB-dependent receptor [Granulicella aggregans]|jgi:TonB-dependent receptor|uniref:TonB-dependent receptor n=1 Tax=Granulicella aggregans TaxID=474949 RepID=UPI0021E0B58D|nr:TonB-dependent receptor [Granulicella aggregans]